MNAITTPKGSCRRGVHPILKAYGSGALSFLTPRLLGLLFARVRRRRNQSDKKAESSTIIARFLRQSVEIHRFPAFCGFTIALRYVLQPLFKVLLSIDCVRKATLLPVSQHAVASFLSGTVAAVGGIKLLNCRQTGDAGRTLDLTLFTLGRAADIVVGELWEQRRKRRTRSGEFTRLEVFVGYLTDSAVFALSSGIIMFTWFYSPEKLPPAYSKQITNMANADMRLVTTLQNIQSGTFVYGKSLENGEPSLLESYCDDLGLPKEWGNPKITIPIPCEVVHGRRTKSCELYALSRFWEAVWKTAFPIYLGLSMVRFLRPQKPKAAELIQALVGALRSSTFLGSFVGLFWYAICLTRTRLGPRFLPLGRLALENLCIKMGCVFCGWSILVEYPQRRTEMMFFVVPRALAALLPRKYDRKYEWIEIVTFAASAGVILATLEHNPKRVRGVFGRLLGKILAQ